MDTSLIFSLISILFLIMFSGFFSGSETGLTAVSRAKVHRLSTAGNKRAKMVGKLRHDKERLLGAILLGNNAVNICASALATSIAIKYFGDSGVAYATIVMTLLILIFAEVLPKTVAFRKALPVSLFVAPVMLVLVKILAPITSVVQLCARGLLRLLGIKKNISEEIDIFDVEALRGAIDLSHSQGTVVKHERDMLGGILDLAAVEVEKIMVHRKNMFTINADEPTATIIQQVLDSEHTRIPLWKGNQDNIIGVLHTKALLRMLRNYEGDMNSLDITSVASEAWFIPESTLLGDQLSAFRKKRMHFALVVDEYGALMGLVTLEDILEEIVGEIDDETDTTSRDIWRQRDGFYKVMGTVPIRDLNRRLGWDLPEENASTIAGLVLYEAQSIPHRGEHFNFHGYDFEVLKRTGNQVAQLRIRKIDVAEEEPITS